MGNCFSSIERKLSLRRRERGVVTPFGHTRLPQSDFYRSRLQQQATSLALAAALQQPNNINRENETNTPFGHTIFPQIDASRSPLQQQALSLVMAAAQQQQNNINNGLVLSGGLIDPDRGGGDESELLNRFFQLMELFEGPHGQHSEMNATTQQSASSSNDASAPQSDQRTVENHAVVIFRLFQGVELGSWRLTNLIDRAIEDVQEDDKEDDPFETLNKLSRITDIKRMPYHDQTETLKYSVKKLQETFRLVQSQPEQFSEMGHHVMTALDDDEEDEDDVQRAIQFQLRMVGALFMDGTLLRNIILIQYAGTLMLWERVRAGLQLPILQELNGLGPTFLTTAGENGYTEIFEGGRVYDINDVQRALHTRNKTPAATVERDVITLAISYRHCGEGLERICQDDLKAIASFIKASHKCRIRFWIDTKLPLTDDGSFERWLVMGMRPYARYMTLICPSTHSMEHRFWIANERFVALASRGIFVFSKGSHEPEIYFSKGVDDFRELAKRMLSLVIGKEELPHGVNKDDEGKMSQWALGILGSDHNSGSVISSGPKVDELRVDDYSENKAMLHIADVIRNDGPITLPLVDGRTWNRQNPLMKGTKSHQEHQMKEWIGLSSSEDKKLVYFLHTFLLFRMNEATSVVLRVRLRSSYDSISCNEIEEKVLMEVPNDDLRRMLPVTVPIESEWSVLSDEQ